MCECVAMTANNTNQTIVRNKFTGYEHSISHKGEFPAISTMRHHLLRSKAEGCCSETVFIRDIVDGVLSKLVIVNGSVRVINDLID